MKFPKSYSLLVQNVLRTAAPDRSTAKLNDYALSNRDGVRTNGLFAAVLWRVKLSGNLPSAATQDYDILIVPKGTPVHVGGVPLYEHFDVPATRP